ncbi:MAG: DUF2752 domain-containing protein [Muribaculaceae bacterium]|nr:DUF2752 domain-containing protein [Muribaculaceae bacterium]
MSGSGHSDRFTIWWRVAIGLCAAAVLALYAFVDPATHLFPRCIFKSLTGLDCPGCGSQRAVHALLTGHIADAWRFNAMLVASLPVLAVMLVAGAMRRRWPRFDAALNSCVAILAWGVAVILWWIGRNL